LIVFVDGLIICTFLCFELKHWNLLIQVVTCQKYFINCFYMHCYILIQGDGSCRQTGWPRTMQYWQNRSHKGTVYTENVPWSVRYYC